MFPFRAERFVQSVRGGERLCHKAFELHSSLNPTATSVQCSRTHSFFARRFSRVASARRDPVVSMLGGVGAEVH